MTLVAALPGFP
jgi:hypothetical protein